MSRHTLTFKGIGEVEFRSLGEGEVKALRRQARITGIPLAASEEDVFLSLAVSRAVVSPQLTNEQIQQAFAGQEHLMVEIADAIVARSWPNQ